MQTDMETLTESPYTAKIKELCAALVALPEFTSIKDRVEKFLETEEVRSKYDVLMMKGEMLQQKHQMGMTTQEEIESFEGERQELLQHPIARDFMAAQKEMHDMQQQAMNYLSKTFELGRVPSSSDFDYSCCDSDCGCH